MIGSSIKETLILIQYACANCKTFSTNTNLLDVLVPSQAIGESPHPFSITVKNLYASCGTRILGKYFGSENSD
jgi:hypothetical protein